MQNARSNPYMVKFNFIGYFILVLPDLPHVQISQVLSLCYPFAGKWPDDLLGNSTVLDTLSSL
jgi:hypothetical protein